MRRISKQKRILCVGEAVIDRIYEMGGNINSDKYIDYLGGAPANIAISLNRLGKSSSFVGRIGNDEGLKNFSKVFSSNNVNTSFIQIDNLNQTRIVKIERTFEGERSFKGFANLNSNINKFADTELNKNEIINDWKNINFDISGLVLGSIPLSNKTSREACFWMIDKANDLNIPIFFDINWRDVFWPNYLNSNLKHNKSIFNLIKIAISKSQFLKVSKEEALLFFNSFDPEEISKEFKNNLDVVITNGGKDIFWYLSNLKGKTKLSFSDNIVDTTGAGDAFLSGMIYQLLNKKQNYNYEEVSKMIKFSSVCGYLTCLKPGAISSQPTLEEVELFLKKSF